MKLGINIECILEYFTSVNDLFVLDPRGGIFSQADAHNAVAQLADRKEHKEAFDRFCAKKGDSFLCEAPVPKWHPWLCDPMDATDGCHIHGSHPCMWHPSVASMVYRVVLVPEPKRCENVVPANEKV